MNQQKQYQQQDVYSQGAQYLNNYGAQLMRDESMDPNDRLTASIISGLAGGLMGGYAQKAQQDYTTQLAQSLRGASKSFNQTGDSSGFYDSPYQKVREIAPLLDFQRDQQMFENQQKMALENQKRTLDFKYSEMGKGRMPTQGADGGLLVQPIQGFGETEAANEAPKKALDLRSNLLLEQAKQGMAVNSPNAIQGNEDKLRGELFTRGGVESLRTINKSFNSMMGNLWDTSGASDLDFIFGTAKALDETSVVREGEQQTMARTDGYFGELNALLGKVKGGQKLSPETRQSLLRLVGSRRDEALKVFDQTTRDVGTVAGNRGASMENINVYGNYKPSSELINPVPYAPDYVRGQQKQAVAPSSPQAAEPMVSIRSKSTGQMIKVPASQLSNYGLR